MNNRIKAEKLEPEKVFENNIDEIKYDHIKIITYTDMNI